MYAPEHRLDTPPPASQFRPRPWSPDPADPLPSFTSLRHQSQYALDADDDWPPRAYPHQRREASDPSVEALDLADYTNTLNPYPRRAAMPGAYEPAFHYDEYPPSPPQRRPFSVQSAYSPPSLVSSPGTLSSQSHIPSYAPHRPFSLPPPSSYQSPAIRHAPDYANRSRPSLESVSPREPGYDSEIDIAHFPAWSHHWYDADKRARQQQATRSPVSEPPLHPAFFDPAFPAASLPNFASKNSHSHESQGPYDPYSTTYDGSQRELLPWAHTDALERGVPMDSEMKEERMRMLEREFGGKGAPGGGAGSEDGPVVGSVDEKGKLITQGPKKRTTMRVLETSLALGIAISSIYPVLMIKPAKPPPPQGKASTFALYILSVVSFLLCLYLFMLRPCCCGGRKRKQSHFTGGMPGGLAVLPVQGLPGAGKKGKKPKKGKHEHGSVQVNLIVDPTMFHGGQREDPADDASAGDDLSSAGFGAAGQVRRPRRRGVFEGLALEEMWIHARKELKWSMFFDIVSLFVWGFEFVWVLIGQKCPPGGFEGWCNAYNVASAGACLLCVAFGIGVFFDVKDLHQSKQSPRTRT
ncbi:hypothetical protein FA95DRAFT_1480193 [Auriscalpium vulgare]|uniref:Uncharacterized protein n=1 Tax=Auriscalpium vulgare TaxID=40419 RepID=A0ACB8SDK1_9AGAM|nr:hypothetical protein FA95DRAFT_1480193 [Auriscalpium vulgare]